MSHYSKWPSGLLLVLSGATAACSGDGGDKKIQESKPWCISKPSQVVMVGDSYIHGFGSPPLRPALAALIPDAANYRDYSVAGMSMAAGGIPVSPPPGIQFVPQQFDPEALQADPDIKLVIMNGGGNDFMLPPAGSPDCKNMADSPTNAACVKIMTDAMDAATKLVTRMYEVGVRDVIYFFYPHLPSVKNGLGGTESNVMMDFAYPKVQALCESALSRSNGQLRCHFIDLRGPFEATGSAAGPGPWTNFVADGVHPTDAGQAISAQQIKNVMDESCLGKPESSGCCEP